MSPISTRICVPTLWLRSDGRVEKRGGTDRQREAAALYNRRDRDAKLGPVKSCNSAVMSDTPINYQLNPSSNENCPWKHLIRKKFVS